MKNSQNPVSEENKAKGKRKTRKMFIVGVGIVALLGVAAGILFAPKSGKETREDLKRKALKSAANLKDTVQKKVVTVKDSTSDATQDICRVIKDVRGKTDEVKKDIMLGFQIIKVDIQDTVDNISYDIKKSPHKLYPSIMGSNSDD